MEDSLMRIFASDRIRAMMGSLGMQNGEAIEHRWVTKSIERAQRKVEGHNFDIRKNLLEYDDVANDQRQVIYRQRDELMAAEDISETILAMREEVVDDLVEQFIPTEAVEEQWDPEGLEAALRGEFASEQPVAQWLAEDQNLDGEGLKAKILEKLAEDYAEKTAQVGDAMMRRFEKQMMLLTLDHLWKEHLQAMDQLRQGIHLRAYAQKQPKQEYKRESFELFQGLLDGIRRDVTRLLAQAKFQPADALEQAERERREAEKAQLRFDQPAPEAPAEGAPGEGNEAPPASEAPAPVRTGPKVGRNQPCPCGSGKKYKHCHGTVA
jgi:preprotein translocase subunit SecA